jgi:ABC-2 type transport system permease protein
MNAVTRLALPMWSLFARELLRFARQPGRIAGALGTPLLFWAVLGSGFGSSLRLGGPTGGMDTVTYFFPGMLLLVVVFAAIFSAISVIQDRTEGFLQGVMAAPVPRLAIVAGKVAGGAALGFVQGLLLLLLAPLAGVPLTAATFAAACGVLLLCALALSGLGFAFAWRMDSVQSFHAVMNLLLFPMWLMSGAFFPPGGAAEWVRWVMRLNPLAYGLSALRGVMQGPGAAQALGEPELGLSLAVLAGFSLAVLCLSAFAAARSDTR